MNIYAVEYMNERGVVSEMCYPAMTENMAKKMFVNDCNGYAIIINIAIVY